MEEKPYNEPRLALNRIYTRLGDDGVTSLAGGQRTGKDELRIEAYGTVDELSAVLGCSRATLIEVRRSFERLAELEVIVHRVQHELFNLGSILSTLPGDVKPGQPRVADADVAQLEVELDRMNRELPPLRSFVLPGGSRLSAELHVCRTVCRRAERLIVALARKEDVPAEALRYINRLSDALFVWARWVDRVTGAREVLWEPNEAASANAPAEST